MPFKLKAVVMQLNAFACFIYILFLTCNKKVTEKNQPPVGRKKFHYDLTFNYLVFNGKSLTLLFRLLPYSINTLSSFNSTMSLLP